MIDFFDEGDFFWWFIGPRASFDIDFLRFCIFLTWRVVPKTRANEWPWAILLDGSIVVYNLSPMLNAFALGCCAHSKKECFGRKITG
jgi:hypothetical protein